MRENKIIAEFMGMEYKNDMYYPTHTLEPIMGIISLFENELYFHSNWNWLMAVVRKISDLNSYKLPSQFNDLSLDSPIEKVYEAALEFINSYNQNKDEHTDNN